MFNVLTGSFSCCGVFLQFISKTIFYIPAVSFEANCIKMRTGCN